METPAELAGMERRFAIFMDILDKYGLTKVINARGPSTILGSAKCVEPVRQAVADALTVNVEMVELQARLSRYIARFSGAEAGCATGCTAAGIAVAVAACMTGDNLALIKELPFGRDLKRKFVIQKGHIIMAGEAPIYQLVRICGGDLEEVGEAADCGVYQLENALDEQTAAALYVMGGRADTVGMIPPRRFIQACRERDIPVIVDDASGLHVRDLISWGADLVIFSCQKWLSGPTAGLIAGRRDLVYACFLQDNGIGRPMKVGKEGIFGAMEAIHQWEQAEAPAADEKQAMVRYMQKRLENIPGVTAVVEQSSLSGSPGWLLVTVDPKTANIPVYEISRRLGDHRPVIRTHDYDFALNYFSIDPVMMEPGDEEIVCDALEKIFKEAAAAAPWDHTMERPTRLDVVAEWMRSWLWREQAFRDGESQSNE